MTELLFQQLFSFWTIDSTLSVISLFSEPDRFLSSTRAFVTQTGVTGVEALIKDAPQPQLPNFPCLPSVAEVSGLKWNRWNAIESSRIRLILEVADTCRGRHSSFFGQISEKKISDDATV